MYHSLFICLPIEGHLSYFQFLAIINKATVNMNAGFYVDLSFSLIWVNI